MIWAFDIGLHMRVRSNDMIRVCFTLVLYLTGKLGECCLDDDELNEFLQYARLRAPLSLSFFINLHSVLLLVSSRLRGIWQSKKERRYCTLRVSQLSL